MPIIKFVNEKKEIQVPGGSNLRREAIRAGVGLYPGINKVLNCHGLGHCGSCRVLITKAINIYERTLEAAERIGAQSTFVDRTRDSLRKMKELLVADAQQDDPAPAASAPASPPAPGPKSRTSPRKN